jgi:Domain of unknown function (DUF927)
VRSEEILSRIQGVKSSGSDPQQYVGLCPAHEDKRHSLSIYVGEKQVLLYDHAGCSIEQVVSSMGIELADLWDDKEIALETKYLYRKVDGAVAFEKIKKVVGGKKSFYQKGRNKQELLYRLPEVVGAVSAGQEVWIVEGEKDAETLVGHGICGTTLPDGANSKIVAEIFEPLQGAAIRIVGDNDEPGRGYVARLVAALDGVAKSINVAYPPFGKDVSDYLALGGSLEGRQWNAACDDFVRKAKSDASAEVLIAEIASVEGFGERARLAQVLSDIRPALKKSGVLRAVNDVVKQRDVERARQEALSFGVDLEDTGWALTKDGVFAQKWNAQAGAWVFDRNNVVCPRPMWVAERCKDTDGNTYLHVKWNGGSKWIAKAVLASKEAICKELGAAPVSAGRTSAVANYLVDCEDRGVDRGIQATVCGWAGDRWYARENVMNPPEPAKGNIEGWKAALGMSYIADCTALLALASPFVRWTCKRNPVLGLVAETSTGKNTVINWALAPWGKVVTLAAQSTVKGIQDAGHAAQDRPVFLDELQNLPDEKVEAALYYVGTGVRRTTSSRAQVSVGGEQRWGVAVFASEVPIEIGMRGGAVNRVVSVYDRPLPEGLELVHRMNDAAENVGWAVDHFDIQSMKDEMVSFHRSATKKLAVREVGVGEMAALILVGAKMLGIEFDVTRFIAQATEERAMSMSESTCGAALQRVLNIMFSGSYVAKGQGLTEGEYRIGTELVGFKLTDGRVDIIPSAKAFGGIDMRRLPRMLVRTGMAEKNGAHCTIPRRTHEGNYIRVIRTKIPAIEL